MDAGRLRRLLLLAAGVVLVETVFYGALSPLLPRFEDDFGLTKSAAGVMVGAYCIGVIVGTIPAAAIASRYGVKATVLCGLGVMGAACLGFAFASNVAEL